MCPEQRTEGDALTARSRIIDTAYQLFSRYGVSAIGVDRVIAEAHVAKMTLYRHFPSKETLILAFLKEREKRWTRDWLEASIEQLAQDPADQAVMLFDVLDEWFRRPDFEGCSFIRTVHEVTSGPVHDAAVAELDVVRQMLAAHARLAGVPDAESFSYQMQILMMGAIVSATRGDLDAATRAQRVAAAWLGLER